MKRKTRIRRPHINPKAANTVMGVGVGYSYARGMTSRFGPHNFQSSSNMQTYNPFANTINDIGDQVDAQDQ